MTVYSSSSRRYVVLPWVIRNSRESFLVYADLIIGLQRSTRTSLCADGVASFSFSDSLVCVLQWSFHDLYGVRFFGESYFEITGVETYWGETKYDFKWAGSLS